MKLLLTAAGLRNDTLRQALRDMLGKPFGSARFVHIPTASNVMPGDRGWLVDELSMLHGLGWREFDVLELNGPPREMVIDRLLHADVIYGGGGNRYHLARSIAGNGLADGFRQALEDRVYVGISGGSMIFSRALDEHAADIFEDDHLRVLGATTMQPPFGFFDWYLQPHLYSTAFPDWDDAWAERVAARADFPIYFIDDDSAVRVDGDAVNVVGEGRWRYVP
jgi:dipeptidase E